MRSKFWKTGSGQVPSKREKIATIVGIMTCVALVTAVLASEQWIRPQEASLYTQQSEVISAQVIEPLAWRMETFLNDYAITEYPPVPNQLYQEARLIAAVEPWQFRSTLLELSREQDARLVKAIAYCLKIGLDNKGAAIALQLLERQHSELSPMLQEIFVDRRLGKRNPADQSFEWIPHAVDRFWYVP